MARRISAKWDHDWVTHLVQCFSCVKTSPYSIKSVFEAGIWRSDLSVCSQIVLMSSLSLGMTRVALRFTYALANKYLPVVLTHETLSAKCRFTNRPATSLQAATRVMKPSTWDTHPPLSNLSSTQCLALNESNKSLSSLFYNGFSTLYPPTSPAPAIVNARPGKRLKGPSNGPWRACKLFVQELFTGFERDLDKG